MADWVFSWCPFSCENIGINSEKCIEYGKYNDSLIDKPQHGYPKRAELPDVNINTERASLKLIKNEWEKNDFFFSVLTKGSNAHGGCVYPYHLQLIKSSISTVYSNAIDWHTSQNPEMVST